MGEAGGVHIQDSIVPGLLISWRSGETKGGPEFSQFSVAFVMMCEYVHSLSSSFHISKMN